MSGGGERSEKATPRRRKKARRDGQIGNSPELGAWLGMLVATFLLPHVFGNLLDTASTAIVRAGAVIRHPTVGAALGTASQAATATLKGMLPLGMLMAVIGVTAVAGQGGIWFAPKLLKPTFKRLNPLSGLKRMFGRQAAWNLTKALVKTAALAAVLWSAVRGVIPKVMGSGALSLHAVVDVAVSSTLSLLRYAAVAGVIMALVDVAVVHRRNAKSLKMTKQEIKEEFKSSEGDPRLKGAVRSRQMAMRRNRMMADVPKADVVVVNPTHVAVALKYEPRKGAPRVVAKGADHLAARIRSVAEQHRVPMVADVPLARTLFDACDIGQEIPPDLFKAVATVLAFIMTLKKRGSAAGVHKVRPLRPVRARAGVR